MHRSLWRHFAILCLIALVFCVGSDALHWHAHAPLRVTWSAALWSAILDSPEKIVRYVALMAGIAVGTSRLGSRGVRAALGVLVAATLAMLLVDLWVNPLFTRANQRAARTYRASWPLPDDTVIYTPRDTLGIIRTAAYLLRDRPAGLAEPLGASWPQDHPRELAADVAIGLPHFLLPFITMGLVLGAVTWQRRRLVFRTPRDEAVARWCTAWVLGPAAWAMLLTWPSHYDVLRQQRPYWWPLFLFLPFLILAALGWRAAGRDDQNDSSAPSR